MKSDESKFYTMASGVRVNKETGEGSDGKWYFPYYKLLRYSKEEIKGKDSRTYETT